MLGTLGELTPLTRDLRGSHSTTLIGRTRASSANFLASLRRLLQVFVMGCSSSSEHASPPKHAIGSFKRRASLHDEDGRLKSRPIGSIVLHSTRKSSLEMHSRQSSLNSALWSTSGKPKSGQASDCSANVAALHCDKAGRRKAHLPIHSPDIVVCDDPRAGHEGPAA